MMGSSNVANTPRRRRAWLIPAGAVIAVVGIPSLLDGHPVFGQDTPALIQEVLANPLVNAIPALLPVPKLLLVVMAALAMVGVRHAPRLLLGYNAAVLVVVGVFQNAADLGGRGFAFLTGNAIAQLALAVCCLISLPTVRAECTPLRTGRVWVIPLAVLAAAESISCAAHGLPPLRRAKVGASLNLHRTGTPRSLSEPCRGDVSWFITWNADWFTT